MKVTKLHLPIRKSAAIPLWLPAPLHDHVGESPVGLFEKDDDDDKPESDNPLQSDKP